jgi:catechol 2,3-dioxygenase-like lactoylglutathione lyase family enzyme
VFRQFVGESDDRLTCGRQIDLVRLVRQVTPGKPKSGTQNVIGIDHAVVVVKDLDKAAENWKRLGFTVSPRGTHSAKMGSGNYTIMLDPDYVELLGVLVETEHNSPTRAFLGKRGEGIERIAFTAIDSAAGAEEIRERGFEPLGPTDFERPVTMPDGRLSAAKFRVFRWPIAEAPGGLGIFACQHQTRDTVWIPELMKHANGAKRLRQVLVVSPEPAKDAAHLARMIDRDVRTESDGAVAVRFGSRRFHFSHETPAGPAVSRSVARGTARARRCRPSACSLRSRRS